MSLRQIIAACFFCGSLIAGLAFGADKKPVLLNGTAATVGKVLITVLDAQFVYAIQEFLAGNSETAPPDTVALRKVVQKMVLEEMVHAEMKSFKFRGTPRFEAEKEIRDQRARGKEAAWKDLLSRFGKSETVAIDRVWKSQQVEKFIQRKVETLAPIVTDTEIERYYKQNQAKFKDEKLETVKPAITALLKQERTQKGLEEWVRYLKEKYGVSNHLEG